MTHRNFLIAAVTAAVVTGGGVALGQATADDHGDVSVSDCHLPAANSEAEREIRRNLLRAMAKHQSKLPAGWTAGNCNYGTSTAP